MPRLVQQTASETFSAQNCTLTIAAPQPGSLMVLATGSYNSTGSDAAVTSVTGAGVTWAVVVTSAVNRRAEIWSGANSTGAGTSVVVSFDKNPEAITFCQLTEWGQMGATSVVGNSSSNSGTSASPTVGTASTTVANEVCIGVVKIAGDPPRVSGPTNSWTDLNMVTTVNAVGYKIPSTAGSQTTGWTFDSSNVYDACIACFKPASVAITGTATASMTETDVRAGGKTIILTLNGGTWVSN